MKAVYTKYLYGNINLQQGSGTLQDYQYYMITAAPVEYFTSEPAIFSDNQPSNFTQFNTSSEAGYGTKFFKHSYEANLTFEFNTENPTIVYNLPIDSPSIVGEPRFYIGGYDKNDKAFSGTIKLECEFGAPIMKT
jgi:hypothetical protein